MRVVILFSIHLLGVALPLISAVVYRKRFIKLPEGKPNETTPAHFARYGAFLIALLLVSLILGFYIGPKLPNQYGEAAFAFVSGIMTGSFAMVFAFPFFMIGPELKKENKAEVFKTLKLASILFVAILIAVAAVVTGIIFFQ